MPGQLLPLRLLQSSSAACLTPMKFCPATRAIPMFTSLFPFKLKYQALARIRQEASGVRRFSSRPIHSRRRGDDRRNPEFLRGRGSQRGEFQLGSVGGRAGQAKSLIEDEGELSDWVSDLKMDSIRLSSDGDDLDDRSRGRDRNSSRNRTGMGRDRFSSSKRLRDGDSDDSLGGVRNASSRSSGGLRNSRVSVVKRRFDSESELEDDGDFPPRRRMEYSSRGDGLSSLAQSGGRRSGMYDRRGQERGSLERGGRGRETQSLERGGRGLERQPLKRGRGRETQSLETGGRGLERQPLKRGRGLESQSLRFLDDDEEDDDNEDEDEMSDIEDSEDETGSSRGASSLSETVKESKQSMPKPSSGNSGSYLSETRCVRVQQLLAF